MKIEQSGYVIMHGTSCLNCTLMLDTGLRFGFVSEKIAYKHASIKTTLC